MISRRFTLPATPWPEHSRAIDLMLAHTRQRLRWVTTRHLIPESSNRNPEGTLGVLSRKQRKTIASIGYRLTAAEIAERYGVSDQTVQIIRRQHGLTKRGRNQYGRGEEER